MNQKQIIAYYLKNMLNSDLGLMTDINFIQNMARYSMEIFDFDITPLLNTLPEDTTVEAKINLYRDILNGKVELLDDSNLQQKTKSQISDAIPQMHTVDITAYDFDKNLSFIADAFGLSQTCRRLLQFFVYIPKMPMLRDVLENFMGPIDRDFMDEDNAVFFEDLCHVPANEIKNLLAPKSIFFTSGILMNRLGNIRLTEKFTKLLSKKFNNADEVHTFLVGEIIKSDLTADNFMHIADDFNNIKKLLKTAAKNKTNGVNILLYGNTGTGKTSFAAAVAAAAGLNLYFGSKDKNDCDARCNELNHTQLLLANDPRAALLMDESDDVLQQERFGPKSSDKPSLNDVLETNAHPVIWIAKSIKNVDKSFLRRFTLTAQISNPDEETKTAIWQKVFKKHKLKISDAELSALVRNNDVPIAILDTAVKNAKLTGDLNMVQYTINKLSFINTGKKQAKEKPFNTGLLNTDTDLKMLADRIAAKNLKNFSLCLYGAPGTGKTAYASYLGHKLNMPVVKKRASDLKDQYIGNTEKNIAAAFEEARSKKAILVFDEADSFLQNRANAQRAWEFSSVNEMLTQMESADFPFICTTNLMESLDPAALRRFTFKVKYDYLTIPQVVMAFDEFFGITISESDVRGCTHLAPGDFVVVKNKASIMDITEPNELIKMLIQEQSVKMHDKTKIGF